MGAALGATPTEDQAHAGPRDHSAQASNVRVDVRSGAVLPELGVLLLKAPLVALDAEAARDLDVVVGRDPGSTSTKVIK